MNVGRKRILFVDDEAAILAGLQGLLRKERVRWDMVFALGGQQALVEMRKTPADVVVTDMRMPGMDGVALLRKIKEEFPASARIVLSGYAERGAVFESLSVAHQFLNKPCSVDLLRAVIERTCNLQELLHDEPLRKVVGSLGGLPSVPRAYAELHRLAGDPSADMSAIAQVVETDPSMSARVLQLVNSAYFGVSQHIASIRQAVSYLGLDLLKGLALTAYIFASVEAQPLAGLSLDELQRCSVLERAGAHRVHLRLGGGSTLGGPFARRAATVLGSHGSRREATPSRSETGRGGVHVGPGPRPWQGRHRDGDAHRLCRDRARRPRP
jgi:DNA-binding NarL/FixJ family response regulator